MSYDPNWPQNGQVADADRFRGQFTGLKDLIDALNAILAAQVDGVTTVNPADPATVDVTLLGNTLHFSFSIPRGLDGQTGATGADGQQGPTGPAGEVTTADLAAAIANALADTSKNSNSVSPLSQTASSSYDQVQIQQLLDKVNELTNALHR